MTSPETPSVFRPPVNRSMKVLDRSFFQKVIPLSAASVSNVKLLGQIRKDLERSGELLRLAMIKPLMDDDSNPGAKCFLLSLGVQTDDPSTWSTTLTRLIESEATRLRPYDLNLTYDDWTMHDILEATLPELPEDEKETPGGFAAVGHVAHLNLRDTYLPYKHLIGQVLLDKNPMITTVINKTYDVGTESVFRTFPYEVLAGPDDLDVTVHESQCEFRFNFGKVYWNTRLGTEHARLWETFHEAEAVCDVMAGVGPFAIPSGKKRVFVRANDLNPFSYASLQDAITRNKVDDFVTASCQDGRVFIRQATADLASCPRSVSIVPKLKVSRNASEAEKTRAREMAHAKTKIYQEPRSFDHYVMNLPASAVEFLDAFRGIYHGREAEFTPHTPDRKLPLIHLYLFQAKHETEKEEHDEICTRISYFIGAKVTQTDTALDLDIRYVRNVAPNKKMYCASFRIPSSVAFDELPLLESLAKLNLEDMDKSPG
ncbi:hypothetical protein B0A52_01814 [Exophiala mesophila]|uniref:tRNA (guanine(37)-N1)-methyltransferase n=1 Tax=Exophiala mesophila TaxID=212818 RepID=A0A438NG34_EXOME|nr:hypothetical protein B0A52_01814 [Exophiala mesophila]